MSKNNIFKGSKRTGKTKALQDALDDIIGNTSDSCIIVIICNNSFELREFLEKNFNQKLEIISGDQTNSESSAKIKCYIIKDNQSLSKDEKLKSETRVCQCKPDYLFWDDALIHDFMMLLKGDLEVNTGIYLTVDPCINRAVGQWNAINYSYLKNIHEFNEIVMNDNDTDDEFLRSDSMSLKVIEKKLDFKYIRSLFENEIKSFECLHCDLERIIQLIFAKNSSMKNNCALLKEKRKFYQNESESLKVECGIFEIEINKVVQYKYENLIFVFEKENINEDTYQEYHSFIYSTVCSQTKQIFFIFIEDEFKIIEKMIEKPVNNANLELIIETINRLLVLNKVHDKKKQFIEHLVHRKILKSQNELNYRNKFVEAFTKLIEFNKKPSTTDERNKMSKMFNKVSTFHAREYEIQAFQHIKAKNLNALKLLFKERRYDLRTESVYDGRTMLMYAVRYSNLDIIKYLVEGEKASLDTVDIWERNLIQTAILTHTRKDILQYLQSIQCAYPNNENLKIIINGTDLDLKNLKNLDKSDDFECTLFQYIVIMYNVDQLAKLLEAYEKIGGVLKDLHPEKTDRRNFNCFTRVTFLRKHDMLHKLLDVFKIQLDYSNKLTKDILFTALWMTDIQIVEWWFENVKNVPLNIVNDECLIHEVAKWEYDDQQTYENMINYLIEKHQGDINKKSKSENNVIMELTASINSASEAQYKFLIEKMFAKYREENAGRSKSDMLNSFTNTNHQNLCHIAADKGNLKIIELAYNDGCLLFNSDSFKCTPFMYAAEYGHLDIVKFIVGVYKNKNISYESNESGNEIDIALRKGFNYIAKYLIQYFNNKISGYSEKVDLSLIDVKSDYLLYPLMLRDWNKKSKIIYFDESDFQWKRIKSSNDWIELEKKIKEACKNNMDGFGKLAEEGDLHIKKEIQNRNEKENSKIKSYRNILSIFEHTDFDFIKGLNLSDSILQYKDSFGATALHIAAAMGRNDLIVWMWYQRQLLTNTFDSLGNSPLFYAAVNQQIDTIILLQYFNINRLFDKKCNFLSGHLEKFQSVENPVLFKKDAMLLELFYAFKALAEANKLKIECQIPSECINKNGVNSENDYGKIQLESNTNELIKHGGIQVSNEK